MNIRPHPDANLSMEQLIRLKDQLVHKRTELVAALEVLNQEIVARQDCSITDSGEAAVLRESFNQANAIAVQHHQTIADIDDALNRIRAGEYGICSETGHPIPYERLCLIPWTRLGLNTH